MTDSPRAPLRVLVIDDNLQMRESLGELLQVTGFEIRTAGDGAAGLKLVDEWHPEAVLIDIQLPDWDGYELAALVRERAGPDLWIAAVTGSPPDTQRPEHAFDVYLLKPVDCPALIAALGDISP